MALTRRALMKLFAGLAAATAGGSHLTPGRAFGSQLTLRKISGADAPHLQAMMNSCVLTDGAFHGKCSEWSLDWAIELVARCPQSVVLIVGNLPVAFQEVPTIRPAPRAPLAANATDEDRVRYAIRRANRARYHLTAAGVRSDALSAADAVALFRRALYYGFRAARRQGFEVGEGFFPWEQHPNMPRKWTDYPGCALVDPPSINPVDGRAVYWLRWRLDEAIAALAAEGAGNEALDVV